MAYWRRARRPRCSRRPQRERPVPHQCRMQTRSRNPRFGSMVALMTNIPQVNIRAEAEAFFASITDADIALRIVADAEGGRVSRRRACASLVASFAAGVRELALERMAAPACSSPLSLRCARASRRIVAKTEAAAYGRGTLGLLDVSRFAQLVRFARWN
jgi:hypothetical protein